MSSAVNVLLAHGSLNAIFLLDAAELGPLARPEREGELRELVRQLNDPAGQLGGGDGAYIFDADHPGMPLVRFYNTDGSSSLLCANGLRCAMRVLMQQRGVSELTVTNGSSQFTGRQAPHFTKDVPAVALSLPPVSFATDKVPLVSRLPEHLDQPLPSLHPTLRFTAVAVPNTHLVAVVQQHDETLLVELGERIAAGIPESPAGANLSFVQVLDDNEVFVRTYERGCGLTPSCGSANVASRMVLSRLGIVPIDASVTLRNAGGVAMGWLEIPTSSTEPNWQLARPWQQGNASYLYTCEIDPDQLLTGRHPAIRPQPVEAEIAAYTTLWQGNLDALADAGVHLGEDTSTTRWTALAG